jgi:hypothetical protein
VSPEEKAWRDWLAKYLGREPTSFERECIRARMIGFVDWARDNEADLLGQEARAAAPPSTTAPHDQPADAEAPAVPRGRS